MIHVGRHARRWGAYAALGIAFLTFAFALTSAAESGQQANRDEAPKSAKHAPASHPLDARPAGPIILVLGHPCDPAGKDGKGEICGPNQSEKPFWVAVFDWLDTHNGIVSALAGIAVACFTGLLIFVGSRQHEAAMGALELAHDEFVATHRPQLRVRRIWPVGKSTFIGNISTEVRIIVANVGGSEARLTALSWNVIFERSRRQRASFQADSETSQYAPAPVVIAPGKQAQINTFSTLDITPGVYAPKQRGARFEVLAIGVMEYEDSTGRPYVLGFSRVYDPKRNRFRILDADDPEADREYED